MENEILRSNMTAVFENQSRLKTKNLGISQRCPPTPVFEILQKNFEKFQKIMKNLKY